MTWNRQTAADALVAVLGAANPGVQIHDSPPNTLNPMCVVVMRPQVVMYNTAAFAIDEATLPVAIVGGTESEDLIDAIRDACRKAIDADPTLGGAVASAYCEQERNWRNVTGAGGVQLLYVELVLLVRM
jgi:hypothetical protein